MLQGEVDVELQKEVHKNHRHVNAGDALSEHGEFLCFRR
jgi:hypothetical protein